MTVKSWRGTVLNMEDKKAEFLKICAERIADGEAKYGPVRSDERNRSQEAIEEVYDAFNYVVPIMLAKHPSIKETIEWGVAVKCIFRLYIALEELKTAEIELENKPVVIA